jgi:hypothetical protein
VRRLFVTLAAGWLALGVVVTLPGCPGRIQDKERFLGRCRQPIDVPTEVFAKTCSDSICHDTSEPGGGLDLISPGVENRLVGQPSNDCDGWLRIDPSSPDDSLILEKLSHDDPACGDRMPAFSDPLTADTIACIREWVHAVAGKPVTDAAATEVGP